MHKPITVVYYYDQVLYTAPSCVCHTSIWLENGRLDEPASPQTQTEVPSAVLTVSVMSGRDKRFSPLCDTLLCGT